MIHNPVLMQALAEARVDELRQTGAARRRDGGPAGRHRITNAVSHRTGWLLIAVGLRLVLSGGAVARGQR